MTNTDEIMTPAESPSEEERRAQNAKRYRNAENYIAEFLELKAKQLLDLQHTDDAASGAASRIVNNAVLSIQRIKEMNDADSRPTADDDADAIERKRAAFVKYADALRTELERQAAARRDEEAGVQKDNLP